MSADHWRLDLGATIISKGKAQFKVWAPKVEGLAVRIISKNKGERDIPFKKNGWGYFEGAAEDVHAGDRYFYLLNNGSKYPDPASRFQPDGVHGPSEIVDPDEFVWEDDDWKGLSLKDCILYELHVGTFTKNGTFESIIPCLDYLKELGVTAVELMPVSQFPGSRNWGYDGVCPFAPQNSYGGPRGLKTLVNACHRKGFAVILDVVYNHLGPEGNYLGQFGYYFTDKYRTPWGEAINFDGPYSDEVRKYFISNALYWVTEYHIDALRIDAIHGIFDFSARHFLEELGEPVHKQAEALGRNIYVIPESDLNDVRVINPVGIGGYGLDAQWNDDFHHALHTLITGEEMGYYEDFGRIGHLEKAYREGFVYSGEYSRFRKRRHGSSTRNRPAHQFIVFSQNHDQVGNRMAGDRLSQTLSLEKLKLAAGVVILSPFIPLLFMGEEYGEVSPFQYFVSHSDEALIEAVRKGRREEFASFSWEGDVPDPQAESAFLNSKINIELHREGRHAKLFRFYKKLIGLRKEVPALSSLSKENMKAECFEEKNTLLIRRWFEDDHVFCLYHFGDRETEIGFTIPEGEWYRVLDSSEDPPSPHPSPSFLLKGGEGVALRPHSFVLYRKAGGGKGGRASS